MADISAAMVKQLRDLTGAGVMACKNALVETDGDMDAAAQVLRKKGEAQAVKKASRIAAEGIVMAEVKDNTAVIVEVNSETDFVAKNEKFQAFVKDVIASIFANDAKDVDALANCPWAADTSMTVGEALVSIIATIGEKISIRRFAKISTSGTLEAYIHGGGRIGVIVESSCESNDANKEVLRNIAMQIAALNPQYIARDDMSSDDLANLKEIVVDSALNDPASLPKPILLKLLDRAVSENVWDEKDLAAYNEQKDNLKYLFNFLSEEGRKAVAALAVSDKEAIVGDKIFSGLVEGRISKQIKEISLMEQTYVKAEDGKQTVSAYLKNAGVSIAKFVRFETGEGIEKKEENFAEEVAKQIG